MFFVSMPNAETALWLVDKAAKWQATAAGSLRCSSNHALAVAALVIVSCVVKVLEAIRNRVLSGFTSLNTSAMCVASTFDTKCTFRSRLQNGLSASVTITGPRSLPPMPRLTTSVIVSPVKPFHSPERTRPTKSFIWSSTAFTSGITSAPSTTIGVLARLRNATWSTARFSVRLIFSPENILFAMSVTFAASTSFSNSDMVSLLMMFLEKSSMMPSKLA
mmetsp:Transcript_46688/g.77256  ORF Transcript_46688/g.77256 Transcript_46688/m.77256 type:complete len:219 (-) Transcript_46688:141-797(-)